MELIRILLVTCIIITTNGLPRCSDPYLDFKGYTYSVDTTTNQRVWSHCKFPNPTADLTRCGFSGNSGPAYICDPDGVLNTTTNVMAQINTQLISIQQNTSTLCDGNGRQRQSYIVAIALVDRIRLADTQLPDSCVNDCNEIHPTLNISSRSPTDDDVNTMMANFAESLRQSWKLGACDNDVVIFYNKQYKKIYTSVGSKAATLLTQSKLSSLHSKFLKYVQEGKTDEGLVLFVEDVKSDLRSFTPAHMLLVITMVIVVLLVVYFIFFLHLSDVELNVWGNEKQWYVFDLLVKFVTGVWFVEAIFIGISHVLNRLSLWVALVCFVAAVGCLVIFFTEDVIFSSKGVINAL